MCGRYALALSNEEVYDALQNQLPRVFQGERRWEREHDHRPNYNIAPRQRAPIVHRAEGSAQAVVETMQWGLIPHWTKHPPTGQMNTINARSESLLDPTSGGMWHALKGHKRCVIPAQGYYEWLKKPPQKIPHFTRLPLTPTHTNEHPPLVFFAGLYDVVKYLAPVESKFQPREGDERVPYPTGNPLPLATFTILTTAPAKDLEWLHDRMPCVLRSEEEVERWLDLGETRGWEEGKGGTGELLRGMPGLESFAVNPEVGKIGTQSPTYIQPVAERSDGIKSFFQKQKPSPAKPKSSSTGPGAKEAATSQSKIIKTEVKPEERSESEIKQEARGIKAEVTEGDVEEGMGDDSNAPNPGAATEAKPEIKDETVSPSKRKREAGTDEEETEKDKDKPAVKKGGHQTKVIRRAEPEKTDQPAITSFFQSPSAKKSQPPPAAKAKPGAKKGRR